MDKREEILIKCDEESDSYGLIFDGDGKIISFDGKVQTIYNAMDENGKRLCLELLEYMAKNSVECLNGGINNPDNKKFFYFKGEWITAKQLFENFL